MARWPYVFISLIVLPKAFQRFGNELLEQIRQGRNLEFNTADALVFFAVIVAMIPFVCWTVALMYKSFSVSCNVKGGKAIGTFIAGLLAAEVLSKICVGLVVEHATVAATIPARPASSGLAVPAVQNVPSESSTEAAGDFAGSGTRFVDLLVREDYAGAVARFDATMKTVMPQAVLQENWQTLLKQVGPFQKQLGTRLEDQAGYKIVFVTCQFERAVLDLKVVFDSQKQVAGLFYVPSQATSDSLKPKGN